MINKILLFLTVGALGGCALKAPVFSWYHPQGGEYLFAFDSDECKAVVAEQGLQLGTDLDAPYFQCMQQRGYYLVGENGVIPATSSKGEVASADETRR